jgi:hypothetical protein
MKKAKIPSLRKVLAQLHLIKILNNLIRSIIIQL